MRLALRFLVEAVVAAAVLAGILSILFLFLS